MLFSKYCESTELYCLLWHKGILIGIRGGLWKLGISLDPILLAKYSIVHQWLWPGTGFVVVFIWSL